MAEKENAVTSYDIVKALSQAASVYDGAHDKDGEPIKAGLKREEGNAILDKRCMDGFKVRFGGNHMILSYHDEPHISDVHKMGIEKYENEIEGHIKDIVAFLKKDYKNYTKGSVTLTQDGETDIRIEPVSRFRTVVTATAKFKIGNMKDVDDHPGEREERKDVESHNQLGGLGGKRPSNDKRKKTDED